MSKFDEKVAFYLAEAKKLNLSIDEQLLSKVTHGLGPSIYSQDSETISATDPTEVALVKNNFLIKKLGLTDGPALDKAIDEVMEQVGKSNKNKYRAIVYTLLVEKLKKHSVYA